MANLWGNMSLKADRLPPSAYKRAPVVAMVPDPAPLDLPPMAWPDYVGPAPMVGNANVMPPPPNPEQSSYLTQDQVNAMAGQQAPMSSLPSIAPPDMSRYKALLDQMDARGAAALEAQRSGIDQFGRQIDATKAIPIQADISPLLALSDTWFGGNLQKGYTPPTPTEAKVSQIMQLQAALQKQKQGLSDDEIALIKSRLGGEESLAKMQAEFQGLKLRKAELGEAQKTRQDFREMQEDQRQVEKLQTGNDLKMMSGVVKSVGAINALKGFISTKGIPNIISNPDDLNTFNSLYASAKLAIKDAEELGALTSSDVDITQGVLGPEGKVLDSMKQKFLGGDATLLRALDTVTDRYEKNFKNKKTLLSKTYQRPRSQELLQEIQNQLDTVKVGGTGGMSPADTEALNWAKNNPNAPESTAILSKLKAEGKL